MSPDIEKAIHRNFSSYSIRHIEPKGAGSQLIKVITGDAGNFICKVRYRSSTLERLEREKEMYECLRGKVPVPKVKFHYADLEKECLCIEELKGMSMDQYIGTMPDEQIVRLFAKALNRIHSLPVDTSVPVFSLERKLELAKLNVQKGYVDISGLQFGFGATSPAAMYAMLVDLRPEAEDLVVTHGDYCAANVIYNSDEVSGFIDVGRGGVADRYQDLAIAVRSIREDFSEPLLSVFFAAYGLVNPDRGRLRFYDVLHEFFP